MEDFINIPRSSSASQYEKRRRALIEVFGTHPETPLSKQISIQEKINAERAAIKREKKAVSRESNKANRRARKNARALEIQKIKEEGVERARLEAERLQAWQAMQAKTQSLTTGAKKKTTTLKKEYTGVKRHLMNNFTVEVTPGKIVTPDPALMKPGALEHYARKYVLRPRFEEEGKKRARAWYEENRAAGFIEGLSKAEQDDLLSATNKMMIDKELAEYLKVLKRHYGPEYRAHLQELATNHLNAKREYEAYNKYNIITTDPFAPKAKLPATSMSKEQIVAHISTRVAADGGTLARNKNLPGFGENVRRMVDEGFISHEEVIDLVRGNNLLYLTPNAAQVAEALDAEELFRMSYGQTLAVIQSGVALSKRSQIKIGKRIGLSEKQQMMIDHENIVKGYNQALRELYKADKENKLRAYAQMKEERVARMKEEKVQAVISSNIRDPGVETVIPNMGRPMAEVAEEVGQVTQKKAISVKTMERLMSSHTLAAGVAAGGLGLMYAMNRKRGEQQVGR